MLDAETGRPLSAFGGSATVAVYDSAGTLIHSASVDPDGSFVTNVGLPAGNYYALALPVSGSSSLIRFVQQVYRGVEPLPISGLPAQLSGGTTIPVILERTTSGIDFRLRRGGSITGHVRDAATSLPLAGAEVHVFTAGGVKVLATLTDRAGFYLAAGLTDGTYVVKTAAADGHLNEVYSGLACAVDCDVRAGTPVTVVANASRTGIDFSLGVGGRIRGRVVDAVSGGPLQGVTVTVWGVTGRGAGIARTDSGGNYETVGLPAGGYLLYTRNEISYIDESYPDAACITAPCTAGATPVTVTGAATTTGIDFALSPGGQIQGRVAAAGGAWDPRRSRGPLRCRRRPPRVGHDRRKRALHVHPRSPERVVLCDDRLPGCAGVPGLRLRRRDVFADGGDGDPRDGGTADHRRRLHPGFLLRRDRHHAIAPAHRRGRRSVQRGVDNDGCERGCILLAVQCRSRVAALPDGLALGAGGIIGGTPLNTRPGTFTVRAVDSQGCTAIRTYTIDFAVLPSFTDDPLVAGVTPVKVVHITELRQAIATLRARQGLAPVAWTDPTIVARVTPIKGAHLIELRTALATVYEAAGRPVPAWMPAAIVDGQTIVTAASLQELRAALAAIW